MSQDPNLVTVHEAASLIEAALLSRRLLDEGIENQIDGPHHTDQDPEKPWQRPRVRVAVDLADQAEVVVGDFLSEAQG